MRIWALFACLSLSEFAGIMPVALAQTKADLKQIDSSIEHSKQALETNTRESEQALTKLQSTEKKIAERSLSFDKTRRKIKTLDKQARFLAAERESITRNVEQAQQRLARLLESAYLMGRHGGLKVILSQQGTQHLARLNHYARDLSLARRNRLDELKSLQHQLDINKRALEQQRDQLNTLTTALREDQRYLGQLKESRLTMIRQMDKAISSGQQEIAHLRARKVKLEALLADIAQRQKVRAARKRDQERRLQAIKNKPPEPPSPKTVIDNTPFSLPANAEIIVYFGQKRKKSGLPWSGILMQGREGTNITAIGAGEVVYADWLQGYGQLVIIDHGNGMMSLYGHNKRIHRTVGDHVKQSDIIASMGNTAGLKKPALYFEIRQDGVAKDPLKWFRS
jgi:septal ring factor EnvC (AmiA/AmiB activator)